MELFSNRYTLLSVSRSVVPNSLWPHGLQPTRLLCPWDFPGKDTGVGGHFLLQGIFPPRDRTRVSCTAGRFFTDWATREAPSKKVKVKSVSCVWLLATQWTVAYQAPLSMEFSRQEYWSGLPFPSPKYFLEPPLFGGGGQEYWSGLPFPSPEDPPDPGIEPGSPVL